MRLLCCRGVGWFGGPGQRGLLADTASLLFYFSLSYLIANFGRVRLLHLRAHTAAPTGLPSTGGAHTSVSQRAITRGSFRHTTTATAAAVLSTPSEHVSFRVGGLTGQATHAITPVSMYGSTAKSEAVGRDVDGVVAVEAIVNMSTRVLDSAMAPTPAQSEEVLDSQAAEEARVGLVRYQAHMWRPVGVRVMAIWAFTLGVVAAGVLLAMYMLTAQQPGETSQSTVDKVNWWRRVYVHHVCVCVCVCLGLYLCLCLFVAHRVCLLACGW